MDDVKTIAPATTMYPTATKDPSIPNYKFKEDKLLDDLQVYIDGTYKAHYAKTDEEVQTFELIAQGQNLRGLHFAIGNILKYADRYGYKEGHNRKDLVKILHYGLMALWAHDEAIRKGVIKE
jgi:hypothetical protein